MIKSNITGRTYSPDNKDCLYCANPKQAYLYLRNGAVLLDILYTETKNDALVFVFKKDQLLKELYQKWMDHALE